MDRHLDTHKYSTNVPGMPHNQDVFYKQPHLNTPATDPYIQNPIAYPIFSEYLIEKFKIFQDADGDGLSNTGTAIRTFLPLGTASRSSLISHNGMRTFQLSDSLFIAEY